MKIDLDRIIDVKTSSSAIDVSSCENPPSKPDREPSVAQLPWTRKPNTFEKIPEEDSSSSEGLVADLSSSRGPVIDPRSDGSHIRDMSFLKNNRADPSSRGNHVQELPSPGSPTAAESSRKCRIRDPAISERPIANVSLAKALLRPSDASPEFKSDIALPLHIKSRLSSDDNSPAELETPTSSTTSSFGCETAMSSRIPRKFTSSGSSKTSLKKNSSAMPERAFGKYKGISRGVLREQVRKIRKFKSSSARGKAIVQEDQVDQNMVADKVSFTHVTLRVLSEAA